jgi:hypothetical protein
LLDGSHAYRDTLKAARKEWHCHLIKYTKTDGRRLNDQKPIPEECRGVTEIMDDPKIMYHHEKYIAVLDKLLLE